MNADADPAALPARDLPRLERLMRSTGGRLALTACGVLLLSLLVTQLALTLAEDEGRTASWSETFLRNLATIGLWGLLFEPIHRVAGGLARRVPNPWLRTLAHVALSLVTAAGVSEVHFAVQEALGLMPAPSATSTRDARDGRDGRREPPPEFAGARPGGGARPGPPSGGGPGGPGGRDAGRAPMPPYNGLYAYWALLGVAWGLDSFLRQRNEERERAALALRASRLERDLVEANLSNLREQLHPHFLFNALHSVGGLIDEGRGELAASLLAELGELLRALLDREPEQLAPLGQELELAERYLEIEGARLGERLSVTFREEVDAARALVPSFLLLPLVENAVRYAIAPRPAGGVLEVDVRREGDALVIELRDDGPGFPPEVLAGEPRGDGERRSIGLANTRSRLAALYGDAAALELTNRVEGGARVRVRLPYDDTRTPGGPPA